MNEKNKRCSMENFNRICLDCGLVPNESKNTMYNNEASYFDLVHPLSEQPIEARKKTKVPLKEFIDFIAPQRELVRNGMVELSVPFNDFGLTVLSKRGIKTEIAFITSGNGCTIQYDVSLERPDERIVR